MLLSSKWETVLQYKSALVEIQVSSQRSRIVLGWTATHWLETTALKSEVREQKSPVCHISHEIL